jgi:butyryl-CoA dehydrogenase
MLLTQEQEMIRDIARDFARRRLAPHSAEWERTSTFPKDALKEMGALGFLGMTVPTEWGGANADYVAYAVALEEIAAGDGTSCLRCDEVIVGTSMVSRRTQSNGVSSSTSTV